MEKQVLKAQEFQLTDENGKIRARLALSEKQTPFLCLYDNETNPKATLLLSESQQPELILYDDNGKPAVVISLNKGLPFLLLNKKEANITLGISQAGHPAIEAYDQKGNPRFYLTIEKEHTGLILSRKDLIKQIAFIASNTNSFIALSAPQGLPMISIDVDDKEPHIFITDKKQEAYIVPLENLMEKLEEERIIVIEKSPNKKDDK